jgi:hypothetical protein
MMMDVSTSGASAGDSGDSELCSSFPGSTSAGSNSSSLIPSSEDSNGGKGIGVSITAIHLAMGDI